MKLPFPRYLTALLAACLILPAAAFGIVPEEAPDAPLLKGVSAPQLAVSPSPVNLGPVEKSQRMDSFLAKYSRDWDVTWDKRSDRPLLIQGAGVPLFAGKGNLLKTTAPQSVEQVAPLLEGFLADNASLLKVSGIDLDLDLDESSMYKSYFWNVEFQQTFAGVPVEGAKVFFRINNGNIIQFGTKLVSDIHINPNPNLTASDALGQVLIEAGIYEKDLAEIRDAGTLKIFPSMLPGEKPAFAYAGSAGDGYDHVLGWEITFKVEGDATTYQAVVDAHSGQVVRLLDLNRYASVQGGVLPTTTSDTEVTEAFSYLAVSDDGGTKITDGSGNYSYSGGTASTALDGRYISINDNCGSISVTGDGSGNIDLGSSSGTDCQTPGFGGAGNTHSARSGHWHLTNINRKAAGFLSGNSWLDGTLTANMNINDTCNAFWDGSTVNFYQSGGGCGNTGEIAAVFLHEWGHGVDTNTGGAASENGSGEALGDTFAFLELQDPCIGPGFFLDGSTCYNCDTCTGVRDVNEFSTLGTKTIASPANVEADGGIDCDRYSCPYANFGIFEYAGPMGYQGHCESHIASTANWDLVNILVGAHGSAGWDVMDSIWYGSLNPSKSAYQVADGGRCNPSAVVNGCGSDNWYTVFLAVDDDNGDLSDGTPNGCHIWDAYDAHGIACGSRPSCSDGGGTTDDPPTADFTFSCTDLSCDFTDASTDDGTISSWDWAFGDGATSTSQNPSHTYGADGTYTVSLTVTDDGGQTGSTSQNVTVSTSTTDDPPVADFTFSCTDLSCDFTDASTDDGTISSWDWAFGDGNTSTSQNPSHTYGAGGTYTVTLTVTDDGGQTDSASQDVTVTEPSTGITLSANGYKQQGRHTIDLTWDGATSTDVDVYRNGSVIATTPNDGAYTDATNNRGGGSYDHQVCEAGTTTCSNVTTTTF